jgi:AbrB family looped-hinge helix DNA binding protein
MGLDHANRWRYRNTEVLSIGDGMTVVTVSPKYQIVIPKEIRESMGIVSGQKVQIIAYQGRIELIPLKPMKEMKGFLTGIDTSVVREEDRI